MTMSALRVYRSAACMSETTRAVAASTAPTLPEHHRDTAIADAAAAVQKHSLHHPYLPVTQTAPSSDCEG